VQEPVDPEEGQSEWIGDRVPRLRRTSAAKLVEGDRDRPHGSIRGHDRQGGDRLPRPTGKVVDAERRPRRQENQLRRDDGNVAPRPEPEQREPELREDPRPLEPARVQDELPRQSHVLGVRRVTSEAERGIGLDRGGELGRRAVEVPPRAVVALLRTDPVCG